MHGNEEETFYLLDGRGLFVAGETERELRRGDLVVMPRGVPHTLAPRGADPLRMLVIVSPAGLEQFFVDVEQRERAGIELDEDSVAALASEYGTRIVGPPIGACPPRRLVQSRHSRQEQVRRGEQDLLAVIGART